MVLLILGGFATAPSIAMGQPTFTQEETTFFENKIRPVLVEHCYECHSVAAANANNLKGGLLLDSREASRKGGESGPAIVPGDSKSSLLLSALHYEDYEMPPAGKLSDAVIADFQQWIEMGAPDPRDGPAIATGRKIDFEAGRKFWSFQPLPAVAEESALGSRPDAIDRFVQKKQQPLGLTSSPLASPRVLVRRAWFDLLGVPPQPEEVATWSKRLSDTNDGAAINKQVWAELIDHLLARPEYGERWARHWMDVARFAESSGYEHDTDRPTAYHYRDFLIKAFNSDLSYKQFVQWQIAGDLIGPEEPLAWMATGFLSAGVLPTQVTETEFEKTRYDELDDMVSTASVAFLGLSLGCARCHDHKFDPVTSEDYYRLVATFTRTIRSEKELNLDPVGNDRRQAEYANQLESARKELDEFAKQELPAEFLAWLAQANLPGFAAKSLSQKGSDPLRRGHEKSIFLASPPKGRTPFGIGSRWEVLTGDVSSSDQTSYTKLKDGSYLAGATVPNQEVVTFVAPVHESFKSLRIEAMADPSLPHQGPGRAGNGNFALCDLRVSLIDAESGEQTLNLQSARATFEQNSTSLAVAAAIDDDPVSGWAVDGQISRDHAAVFDVASLPRIEPGSQLRIELAFRHPNPRHSMGRMRFSLTKSANAAAETGEIGIPENVMQALVKLQSMTPDELSQRTDSIDQALEWYKSQSAGYQTLAGKVAEIERAGPGIQLAKVLVAGDDLPRLPHNADDRGYPHFYPETYLLRRGDVEQKVSVVTPGVPQVLRKASTAPDVDAETTETERDARSRQRLAEWVTDPDSGGGALAARVMANRIWQHHFGRGLVATPNDFGETGERPSHPELLDWMAGILISDGWRLKPLHKAIMTSQTYMQSHRLPNDSRSQIDPDNRFLWHRAPRRMEAETIRDSLLVVAGELDSSMYGPGSLDQNMKRRSVYFSVKRSQLIPSLMLFDWPEHLVSIGQRQATTVAPQALLFMNSAQGRSYAESFARRVLNNGSTLRVDHRDAENRVTDPSEIAVTNAYAVAYGRDPSAAELKMSLEYWTAAEQLRTSQGESEARVMALADLCQMLMSTNEFIYID